MTRRATRIVLAAIAAAAALSGLAGDTACVMAQGQVLSQSPSCRSGCLAEYNQCRITTKGSLTCDSQYQTCLQSCVVRN